jgi:exopolysaccharide biosynthesis polyprenyl glycosylphosphotransferase
MVWETALAIGLWEAMYYVRFEGGWFEAPKGVPPAALYQLAAPLVGLAFFLVFRGYGLYSPWRHRGFGGELAVLVRAFALGTLVLAGLSYFYHELLLSRFFLLLFLVTYAGVVVLGRALIRFALHEMRRRGRNLRHCVFVGDDAHARAMAAQVERNAWMGLKVLGFVGDAGGDVLGTYAELPRVFTGRTVDQVFITVPPGDPRFAELVHQAHVEGVTVRVVPSPALFGPLINARVEQVAGMAVYTLIDTPLSGPGAAAKRAFDVVFSLAVLVLLAPLLFAVAVAVRLTSPGPVLYRQERAGLDGRPFGMLKFRTMPVNAERASGPVWNKKDENRATPVGAFLRRTSLDELPQFWNVLRGDMSVVGPRPERPYFIDKFKHEIRLYNVRHKMKAGITGWAQVNGWRGDTSLEKRIEADLFYLQHWSFGLDLVIIARTVFGGLWHENAR